MNRYLLFLSIFTVLISSTNILKGEEMLDEFGCNLYERKKFGLVQNWEYREDNYNARATSAIWDTVVALGHDCVDDGADGLRCKTGDPKVTAYLKYTLEETGIGSIAYTWKSNFDYDTQKDMEEAIYEDLEDKYGSESEITPDVFPGDIVFFDVRKWCEGWDVIALTTNAIHYKKLQFDSKYDANEKLPVVGIIHMPYIYYEAVYLRNAIDNEKALNQKKKNKEDFSKDLY